jgi:hypothetical protein
MLSRNGPRQISTIGTAVAMFSLSVYGQNCANGSFPDWLNQANMIVSRRKRPTRKNKKAREWEN